MVFPTCQCKHLVFRLSLQTLLFGFSFEKLRPKEYHLQEKGKGHSPTWVQTWKSIRSPDHPCAILTQKVLPPGTGQKERDRLERTRESGRGDVRRGCKAILAGSGGEATVLSGCPRFSGRRASPLPSVAKDEAHPTHPLRCPTGATRRVPAGQGLSAAGAPGAGQARAGSA